MRFPLVLLGVPLAWALAQLGIMPRPGKFPGTEASLARGYEWFFKCGLFTLGFIVFALLAATAILL